MQKLSTLLLIIILSMRVFGQQETKPKECTNPPAGIQVGGSFSVSPEYACLDSITPKANILVSNAISPSGGQFTNLGYIFNFKDGDNIQFSTGNPSSTIVSKPGTYWVLQGGNDEGSAYITCKSFEIQPQIPDFTVTNCNDKGVTVTFTNTPKNRKLSQYRIIWGDGTQSLSNISVLPHVSTHLYSTPATNKPELVAIYKINSSNSTICQSSPIPFSYSLPINNKPRISELQSIGLGTGAKITLIEGMEDNPYTIQRKGKDGIWTDTDLQITRNKGNTYAQQIIDSLNISDEYCFRLQTKDNCGNDFFSNEVCNIKLNVALLSDKQIKLDWNAPSANVNLYLINYSNYPTTESTISTTSTSRIIDYLDCKLKYSFQITAIIDTTQSSQTRIKSPQIIIDPSSIKEYPAPNNISTVSVDNSNNIKYNILESSGRKAKYLYYRSVNGNSFEKVAESIENFYIDKDVDLNKNQYCYAYKYENECGVQSALSINKGCNVKLSLNNTSLEWTPFSIDINSKAIAEYTIEGLNEDNSFITQLGTTTKTNFNILDVWNVLPNNITKFRIQAKITASQFPSAVYSNPIGLPILSTSKEADRFNIFPNPSEDFVQLNSTLQLKTAEIVNLQGKIIENQSIENGQVSVRHLPKGRYILRLYGNDKKLISSKVIIKM